MKNFTSALISVAFLTLAACSTTTSFAQSSASSETSATIVTPLSMEKLADLEFTNVPVRQASAKINVRHSSVWGKSNRNHTVAAGNVTAASFTVSGYPHYAYGVTLPATVTMAFGTRTITIGTALSSASANYTLSAHGTDALSIAGTVSVNDQQLVAMNTDTEGFPVTIIYN